MTIKIQNLTEKPLSPPLNSGEAILIAPNKLSRELPDHEVAGNAKLKKMQDAGAIALHTSGGGKPAGKQKPEGEQEPEKEKSRRSS